MAIGHVVVYFARAGHAFSAGIKCRHCRSSIVFIVSTFGVGNDSNMWVRYVGITFWGDYSFYLKMCVSYMFYVVWELEGRKKL